MSDARKTQQLATSAGSPARFRGMACAQPSTTLGSRMSVISVRIKPGEKAPVDGIVVDGVSYFDESLLTGESVPVKKEPGETIVAGSLNG